MTTTTPVSPVDPDDFSWEHSPAGSEVRRILESANLADGRGPLDEATLLRLRHRGIEGARLYLATSGFALVSDGIEQRSLDVVVAPEARRRGVGADLVEVALKGTTGPVVAWSHGNHPAAAALAAAFDFARIRDLWVMRRAMSQELPAIASRQDVVVRPFIPGQDEEAFLAVNAAAFAHHPEQGDMTRADLDERIAEPWFDPAGFFLAERDGHLLGFHWTKVHGDSAGSPSHGEVYVVGVAPQAQGLGLGKLLTLTGLHHLRDQGLTEVILYVESDNAAAVAVYEGLGFSHASADTDVMYRRD